MFRRWSRERRKEKEQGCQLGWAYISASHHFRDLARSYKSSWHDMYSKWDFMSNIVSCVWRSAKLCLQTKFSQCLLARLWWPSLVWGASFSSVPISTIPFSTSVGKLILTEKAMNVLCYYIFRKLWRKLDPASGPSSYDTPTSANSRTMSTYASESRAKRNPP